MNPTKHRIAATVFLLLFAFAVVGILLEGGRLGWDLEASSSFGMRGNTPLGFAIVAMSGFALVMAAAAVWQFRRALSG